MDAKVPIFIFLSVLISFYTSQGQDTSGDAECVKGPSIWYKGTRDRTASGIPCQRWDVETPHKPNHIPKDGGHHNYCRNPDSDLRGTWCYTTDNATRWEYCNITKCKDESLVIWTNYDGASESTHLLSVQADPEIVKQETDNSGTFNVTVVTGTNKSMSEFWALAADYGEKSLYFTDYRSEYVGVRRMGYNMTLRHFEGMAHGIESMAFDWVTKNLYWSDSEFKWIMAAETSFRYYYPVYRTDPDPPYGLAIHAVKRMLIFSTYKALGSKIITTDMAGKNPKTLFKFPQVFDVTGITVDYTDDRIYWTDFTGYGGMVMSSRMDGSNKTQHHYRGGSIFWGVAAYMDYLYVTDVHARYSMTADRFYSVWIITKATKQVFRYTLNGKPRGIAVYSENEEYSDDDAPSVDGDCDSQSPCDHICLPRVNATRECACSLGYHLDQTGNKCIPKLIEDEYLLLADAGQGKVFQIPINISGDVQDNSYSVVPLGQNWKTVTIAVDTKTKFLYWSDKKSPSVNKGILDGSRSSTLAKKHANSIVVDPQTGNVFWSDNDNDNIYVSNTDGTMTKSIIRPATGSENTTSIRMIVQDLKNRFLYWTDTNSAEDKGQVIRCRFDGTERTVVFDKLNWPHAITIDYGMNALFIAEAKQAMIYQVSLDEIATINSTSIKEPVHKQHDISPYISRISPYIIDIKIHKDMLYVVDGKSSRLERFNITAGPSTMKPYGPAHFFRVTTVSVFSENTYNKYIKPIVNPCVNNFCRMMCVAKSDSDSVCMCPEGQKAVGIVCVPDGTAELPNEAPSYGSTCPLEINVRTTECEKDATVIWTPPTWTDDKTPYSALRFSKPIYSPPHRFSEGTYELVYTATDTSNNVGHCRFKINVESTKCPPPPAAKPGMIKSKLLCENYVGTEFNVTCQDPTLRVFSSGRYFDSYTVTCAHPGIWLTSMGADAKCVRAPTTTTTTTTTSTASTPGTTTSSTPFVITTSSTPPTPKSTTSTSTQQPTTKTTIATTKTTTATTTATTPPPKTVPPTPSTNQPTVSTTSTTSGTTSKATKGTADKIEGAPNVEKSESSGLGGGAVAAIVIVVIALILIVVIIAFVTLRRSHPLLMRMRFPIFWKPRDDTVDLHVSDDNHYTVM